MEACDGCGKALAFIENENSLNKLLFLGAIMGIPTRGAS
jgi:hypothetical protein